MMMSDSGDVAVAFDHLSVKCILAAGHVNKTEYAIKVAGFSIMLRRFLFGLGTILVLSGSASALDPINSTGAGHLAIRGTDTTSYFQKGGPEAGRGNHVVNWKGATWRFGSATEAAQFRANPEAFAPQFGAYCTGGLSQQHVVEGKPQHWRIHNKKLYLFHTATGAMRFSKDPAGTIRKAQAYWDTLDVTQ